MDYAKMYLHDHKVTLSYEWNGKQWVCVTAYCPVN